MCRVGQNRIYTPYMTVYLVIPCQKDRMCTVYIYGSGQPYIRVMLCVCEILHDEGAWALHA